MTGSVLQINISRGGVPKLPVPDCLLTPLGLEGDGHAHPEIHGGPNQALLLIGIETIEDLAARGYPVYAGALGENLTTRGLDRTQVRIGQQLRIGPALIEITRVRGPCTALDVYGPSIKHEIYDRNVKDGDHTSPRWGMSGFYARVLVPGALRTGDIISLVATLA